MKQKKLLTDSKSCEKLWKVLAHTQRFKLRNTVISILYCYSDHTSGFATRPARRTAGPSSAQLFYTKLSQQLLLLQSDTRHHDLQPAAVCRSPQISDSWHMHLWQHHWQIPELICGPYSSMIPPVVPSVLWRRWLSGRKGIRPGKTEWWGTSMVICLEQGANDLHMVQLMPPPPHHLLLR